MKESKELRIKLFICRVLILRGDKRGFDNILALIREICKAVDESEAHINEA